MLAMRARRAGAHPQFSWTREMPPPGASPARTRMYDHAHTGFAVPDGRTVMLHV